MCSPQPRQNPKKGKKGKGQLRVEHAEIRKKATLLEYLAGGLQLGMTVRVPWVALSSLRCVETHNAILFRRRRTHVKTKCTLRYETTVVMV